MGRTRCKRRSPRVTPGRARPAETDWERIAALYAALAELAPSPVVELNRAVALSMAFGPAAGLELVDALTAGAVAQGLPPAAGGARRPAGEARSPREARAEFERAAALTRNARERDLLLNRARATAADTPPPPEQP